MLGEPCIAFYKYDGSNLRWEWSPKKGWYKYGTRNQLFDANATPYNQAIPIFHDTMADDIVSKVMAREGRKVERIIAFTEFFGPSSFAGSHDEKEEKELILFDVSVYKKGFIPAKEFVKMFNQFPFMADVIYEGNMNKQFIEDVWSGKYPLNEGVVCKGNQWQAKIKTQTYLTRLLNRFGPDWERYE
ncbi:MAG: hypothetical protein KGI25_08740 [Thaumarchaeota archaeon]|nr:hypothetical protein [Nitrososphaerota archaeon]